ncbi:hypothetical protein DY000_02018621 [Brassica cretica]|uniref:Uncharacterized protein n=1 Tax=Brassica cretica TaxID=69181 RepID=A0ABQ7DA69_BRACR|nr:hypothetical protein DY000_02018621 [Brassica cretica]
MFESEKEAKKEVFTKYRVQWSGVLDTLTKGSIEGVKRRGERGDAVTQVHLNVYDITHVNNYLC